MESVLLICEKTDDLKYLDSGLRDRNFKVIHVGSDKEAVNLVRETSVDLAVIGEHVSGITGIELAELLVVANPMVLTAVVSGLSESEFHEKSEGLGVLMQLPVNPGKDDADVLVKRSEAILGSGKSGSFRKEE